MTVSSTTNRKSFTGDDVTVAFGTSPVVFFDDTDLEVYLVTTATGASVLQTLTTDYTVSGGAGSTGTVTMLTAPASTETLVILRVLPFTQTDDFINNDINDAEVLEDRLDKLTMLTQQLDEVDARALKLGEAETASAALTELPFDRASKFLAFDASKNMIASADPGGYPASVFMATVLDDTTAADARTTLGAATAGALASSGITGAAASGSNSDITALTALTSGTPFRKNAIINGDFQIWQEGTSFAAIADQTYTAEMWKYAKVGAMVHTVSQSSDVPTIAEAGRKIPFSVLVDCTTVDAAIAAGDFCGLAAYIEGSNFVNIAGVGLCMQFWHKHTKTGTYCVSFLNSAGDRTFIREYTQAVSDTWEFATVLVDASPTAGTWNYTTGIGLQVFFMLACGTDFQGAAGSWNSALDLSTSNQVNACDSDANNFQIAGVQLEKGSVATEFEAMKIQDVQDLCERYFRTTYNRGVAPGTTTNLGAQRSSSDGASNFYASWRFGRMRTSPTMTVYSPNTGASGNVRNETTGADVASGFNATYQGDQIGHLSVIFAAANQVGTFQAKANARF